MLGALVVFIGTLFMTLVIGIPVATRLARVHVWKRTALPDLAEENRAVHKTRFEPVDFGPDLVLWPSEVDREVTAIPEPPWPSSAWDDPHFGKTGLPPEQLQEVQKRSKKKKKKKQRPQPAPQKPQLRRDPPAEKPRRVERQPEPPPRQERRREPEPPRQQPAPRAPETGGLPNRDQVEQMVAEMGLAGTVQHLMKTQGWDFKTAAGWLGRIRRG